MLGACAQGICGGRPAPKAKVDVRTAKSPHVPADVALARLREGNDRFVACLSRPAVPSSTRVALATDGQLPMAAVLGCADSRCPVEMMFDAAPGDIFVCRNAGNSIAHAMGSVVASMEYCVGHLNTKLLVVLGHTKCGAIKGAVASIPAADAGPNPDASVLESYLASLTPVARKAKAELPATASDAEVAEHAVRVNVLSTVSRMLEASALLSEKVRAGELKVHGAVYDITSGRVEFLGEAQKAGGGSPMTDTLMGA